MNKRWHPQVLLKRQLHKHREARPNAVNEKQPLRMVCQYIQPPIGRAPGVNLKPMSEENTNIKTYQVVYLVPSFISEINVSSNRFAFLCFNKAAVWPAQNDLKSGFASFVAG